MLKIMPCPAPPALEHKAKSEIVLKVVPCPTPEHKADRETVLEVVKQNGNPLKHVALCEIAPAFTPKQLRTPLTRRVYRRSMFSRVMLAEG